jgi:hypothetical protein
MRVETKPPIASVLEGSLDLRAAGAGKLTKTADRPIDLESARPHVHEDQPDPTDEPAE